MKFLRILFTIGYVFFGGMFLYALSVVMLKNGWIELFNIHETTPIQIEFVELEKKSTEIRYSFEFEGVEYTGKRVLFDEYITKSLPEKEHISVSFNTLLPKINYLGQLGIREQRSESIGMIISGFFILFFLLLDMFADKKKWLKVYGLD